MADEPVDRSRLPIADPAFTGVANRTGGDVRLFANGNEIGKGRMDHSVPVRFSGYSGMDIGLHQAAHHGHVAHGISG